MRNKYTGVIAALFVLSLSFPASCAQDREAAQELLLMQAEASETAKAPAAEQAKVTELEQEEVLDKEGEYRQKLRRMVTAEEEEKPNEIDSFVRYMPKTTLKGQAGKISIVHNESEYSYSFKVWDVLPVQVGFMEEYISIDKDDTVPLTLPAKLTALSLNAQVTLPFFFDSTYLRLRVMPGSASDNWNCNSSSIRIPSQAFFIYQPSEMLTFILGVASFPSSETPVAPIAGMIYKPNDKLTFNIIPPSPSISYDFNDKLSVFFLGDFVGSEFRVEKDGYKSAILNYNEAHLGAGLSYDINKNVNLAVSSGYMFNRSLKYGDSLGKASLKNSIYTELRLEIGI